MAGSIGTRQLIASGDWKRPREERIPPIADLIQALDEELFKQKRSAQGAIGFIYSILCDTVHPSWGGDFIYSPQMYRELNPNPVLDDHFKVLATLFCLPTIEVVNHIVLLSDALAKDELRIMGWL